MTGLIILIRTFQVVMFFVALYFAYLGVRGLWKMERDK